MGPDGADIVTWASNVTMREAGKHRILRMTRARGLVSATKDGWLIL